MNTIVKEGLRFVAWTAASVCGGVIAVKIHDKAVKVLVDEKKEKIAAWMEKETNKELFTFLDALPVNGWEEAEDEKKLDEYLLCIKIVNTNRFNLQSIIRRKKETTDKPAE